MNLTSIASYFDNINIDVLRDSDNVWVINKLKGQLKLSDDFISIFNRPTRRRMLLLSPQEHRKLDGSVIRLPESGEIYLLGNPQQDLGNLGVYRVTIPINKITTKVEVFRKLTLGTIEDPGSLETVSRGEFYMDLELRSVDSKGDTINEVTTKYFFWFPKNITFQIGDEFDHDQKTFRVLESYFDTGFRGIRATSEDDSREPLIYRELLSEPVYDNLTGDYVSTYKNTVFSAEVKEQTTTRRNNGQLYVDKVYTVLIENYHIAVEPTVKGLINIDGDDKSIESIIRHRHDKSWEITCQ